MPRRNRPRKRGRARARLDDEPEPLRAPDVVAAAPEGWQVRLIQPASATKEYRCPGCNQQVRVGTKHVVVWRDASEEHRRHWHLPCWQRSRR